ncbi:putative cytochrome P450 protein [Dirofilaria immitis]
MPHCTFLSVYAKRKKRLNYTSFPYSHCLTVCIDRRRLIDIIVLKKYKIFKFRISTVPLVKNQSSSILLLRKTSNH